MTFETPKVMGIVNVTPDSFFSLSRTPQEEEIERRAIKMVDEGVDIFDIGGYSSRPGADDISAEEEYERLNRGLKILRRVAPQIPISVDTFRANVARKCVEDWNVEIINDISGGTLDDNMFSTIAELGVVYILMHMRGNPSNMQELTDYNNVTAEVLQFLMQKVRELHLLGVNDIILDPGFGFAKTIDQNYQLLAEMDVFKESNLPILAGLSRKSMIWRSLNITPEESLNGTTVLNTISLLKGADILRVHDVRQAKETIFLTNKLKENSHV